MQAEDAFTGLEGKTVRDVLLKPTVIYVEIIRNLMRDFTLKGMAHITGGGFFENIPRVLPSQVVAEIDFNSWPKSPLFQWLKKTGELEWPEMLQIFNCGIGFVLVVAKNDVDEVLRRLQALGQPAWQIGNIRKMDGQDQEQVAVSF